MIKLKLHTQTDLPNTNVMTRIPAEEIQFTFMSNF